MEKLSAKEKQPMRIMLKDESVFSMAALYDTWTSPEGTKLSTCSIITTAPNSLMQPIHDRMPVILNKENEALWLDRNNQNTDELLAMLKPYSTDEMKAYPVSSIVGNVNNDNEECIKQL